MVRIKPVNENNETAKELLEVVKKKMGTVPNFISGMANSPAVLKSYLNFSQSLATGDLPLKLREQIALLVSQFNECEYCISAHTVLGQGAGLSERDTENARAGISSDQKEQALYTFVKKVLKNRAHIIDSDIEALRKEGYNNGEITEIVANIVVNIFTNYFNIIAATEIDFPVARELNVA
jgi:uncharacterized peroxidase-related enzyme